MNLYKNLTSNFAGLATNGLGPQVWPRGHNSYFHWACKPARFLNEIYVWTEMNVSIIVRGGSRFLWKVCNPPTRWRSPEDSNMKVRILLHKILKCWKNKRRCYINKWLTSSGFICLLSICTCRADCISLQTARRRAWLSVRSSIYTALSSHFILLANSDEPILQWR